VNPIRILVHFMIVKQLIYTLNTRVTQIWMRKYALSVIGSWSQLAITKEWSV